MWALVFPIVSERVSGVNAISFGFDEVLWENWLPLAAQSSPLLWAVERLLGVPDIANRVPTAVVSFCIARFCLNAERLDFDACDPFESCRALLYDHEGSREAWDEEDMFQNRNMFWMSWWQPDLPLKSFLARGPLNGRLILIKNGRHYLVFCEISRWCHECVFRLSLSGRRYFYGFFLHGVKYEWVLVVKPSTAILLSYN